MFHRVFSPVVLYNSYETDQTANEYEEQNNRLDQSHPTEDHINSSVPWLAQSDPSYPPGDVPFDDGSLSRTSQVSIRSDQNQKVANSFTFIDESSQYFSGASENVTSSSSIQSDLPNSSSVIPLTIEVLINELKSNENIRAALKQKFPLAKFYDCKSVYDSFEQVIQNINLKKKYITDFSRRGININESDPHLEKLTKKDTFEEDSKWRLIFFNLLLDNPVDTLSDKINIYKYNKSQTRGLHRPAYCGLAYALFDILDAGGITEEDINEFRKARYPNGFESFPRSRLKLLPGVNKFIVDTKDPNDQSIFSFTNEEHDRINFVIGKADWYRTNVGRYIHVAQDVRDNREVIQSSSKNTQRTLRQGEISKDVFTSDGLKYLLADKELKGMLYPKSPRKKRVG